MNCQYSARDHAKKQIDLRCRAQSSFFADADTETSAAHSFCKDFRRGLFPVRYHDSPIFSICGTALGLRDKPRD